MMTARPEARTGSNQISLIFIGFSSAFKAQAKPPDGIDEARAINDCPGQI